MRAATISPDGRWLAYASNDTNRFEVYLQAFPNLGARGDQLEAGTPTLLFEGQFAVSTVSGGDAWYDVSPDGKRFLMLKNEERPSSSASIVVVQNWTTELRRLAPAK